MKTMFVLLILGGFSISSAQAAIVCEGKTQFGNTLTLTLTENQSAHVEVVNQDGTKELEQDFRGTANVWDGHATGLVTAPGLSVKYSNWFGCIRNVVVTTNIRDGGVGYIDSVNISACRGGSTSDELCLH